MSVYPLSEMEMAAVSHFLKSITVPIVRKHESGLELLGSGAFFELKKHGLVLVSAAHILPWSEEGLMEIAVPTVKDEILTFGKLRAHKPEPDELDVAVINIDDEQFKIHVRENWRVLTEESLAADAASSSHFVVAGYPVQKLSEHGGFDPKAFCQFYSSRYVGPPVSDRQNDLLLSFSKDAIGPDGSKKSTPNLKGLSGAPVWAVGNVDGIFWAAEKCLKIVGVQEAFNHTSYIAAKPWALVAEVLRRL